MTSQDNEDSEVSRLLAQPYSWIVIPQDNGAYSAHVLEFQGCNAEGESADEALRNLQDAADGWIRACLATGQEIPKPGSKRSHPYGEVFDSKSEKLGSIPNGITCRRATWCERCESYWQCGCE